jgi:hypothetical protein
MNPQARYEGLVAAMLEGDAVEAGQMFGKPCLKVRGKAFAAFHEDRLVFKLAGTSREAALKEKRAALWDPSGKGRPMKEWIAISGKTTFDELAYAKAAYEYVSNQKG